MSTTDYTTPGKTSGKEAVKAIATFKAVKGFYLDTKFVKPGDTVEMSATQAEYLGVAVQPATASI